MTLALRHAGQSAALAADAACHREYATYLDAAIDALVRRGATFSSDEVRLVATQLARVDGRDLSLMGTNVLPSVMGHAVRSGRIVRLPRDVNSSRRSRHASRIGTYRGAA